MEMAYRARWQAEIAALQRILAGFDLSLSLRRREAVSDADRRIEKAMPAIFEGRGFLERR